jgi:hypothetical protein
MRKQLIMSEKFTNIQKAQAGLTKLFQEAAETSSFFRVLKNDQPMGVLVPTAVWNELIREMDDLQEDLEALSSPNFLKSIERSRKSKKYYTAEEIKEEFGL